MKSIYSLLTSVALLLLIATTANAQVKFGVKGGLNISSVSFNSDLLKSDNVTGFHIGPLLEVMTPLGIGFDGAILYAQKGMDFAEVAIKTDYIEVPVNLKWKIGPPPIGYIFKAWVAAGPYIAFRVSEPEALVDSWEAKSFAAGINLGIGVELFTHLQIGFTYGLGLTNDYSASLIETDVVGKNRTKSLTAVILF